MILERLVSNKNRTSDLVVNLRLNALNNRLKAEIAIEKLIFVDVRIEVFE